MKPKEPFLVHGSLTFQLKDTVANATVMKKIYTREEQNVHGTK